MAVRTLTPVSPETGERKSSSRLFFCSEECQDRYGLDSRTGDLVAGEEKAPSIGIRCGSCGEPVISRVAPNAEFVGAGDEVVVLSDSTSRGILQDVEGEEACVRRAEDDTLVYVAYTDVAHPDSPAAREVEQGAASKPFGEDLAEYLEEVAAVGVATGGDETSCEIDLAPEDDSDVLLVRAVDGEWDAGFDLVHLTWNRVELARVEARGGKPMFEYVAALATALLARER